MSFIVKTADYSLEKTLKSGQAFRYKEMATNVFRVMSRDKVCYAKQIEDSIYINSGESSALCEDDSYWKTYFNFRRLQTNIPFLVTGNPFLEDVVKFNRGLRLLQQDPWETLICFIIYKQKRIPQIQSTVEKVCRAAGNYIGDDLYAFPSAKDILSWSIHECGLGFRESYILAAADAVCSGSLDLGNLKAETCSYKSCIQQLCAIHGVGVKVANCTALFALGHTEAFPIDVHIDRILKLPEMKGFRPSDYGEDAGLMQQYLFNYALAYGI